MFISCDARRRGMITQQPQGWTKEEAADYAARLRKETGDVPFYLMAPPMALVEDQPALVASIRGQRNGGR